jgi:hypothetical protein
MTLLRLVLGWAAVTLWFVVFELVEQRLAGLAPAEGKKLRAGWKVYVADALLLTLFAGLWFASLGHGGWVLLFLMTGLLVEGPARFRDGSGTIDFSGKGIVRLLLGLVRIVGAGGILAWRL